MKVFNLIAVCCFFFTAMELKSQLSPLNDPEIIWIGESTIIFNPDKSRLELSSQKISGFTHSLKKISANSELSTFSVHNEHLTLAANLLSEEQIKNPAVKIYADSLLKNEIPVDERLKAITFIDTIIYFDPNTLKEYKQIMDLRAEGASVSYYKMRIQVYYHKKDKIFRTKVLAIAPVIFTHKTLFWIAVSETDKTDIANPDKNWLVRVAYECPLMEKVQVLKKSDKNAFEYLNESLKNAEITVYAPDEILGFGSDPYSKEKTAKLGTEMDTIITFDPNTFEKATHVRPAKINMDAIKNIRIVQDWVWDNKNKKLYIRPLGYAPLMDHYDEIGNFLSRGPLFYVREKGVK